jgi:RNA recognition motif-containing protein
MQIVVGHLAATTTAEALAQLFDPYGRIASVRLITARDTGWSRSFALVEMPDATAAQAALDGRQGATLGGRTLTVNEARQREEQRPRG